MPFAEKYPGRQSSTTRRSFSQPHHRQTPSACAATTATGRQTSVRKSRSISHEDNSIAMAGERQRSKSRSLSRASHRSSPTSGGVGGMMASRHPRSPISSSKHRRTAGIPNISIRRRRGRSETPKVDGGDAGKQQQHQFLHRSGGGGGGGIMNKFRSLSRSAPHFSMRGDRNDRGGSRTRPHQQHQQQSMHQREHHRQRSPSQEHQFHRHNTSNEARGRKFNNTDRDDTSLLPIPIRGKSMPSRLKVSLRLSRDYDHSHNTKEKMHANSSRSRSRHRSSDDGGTIFPAASKLRSNSHGKRNKVHDVRSSGLKRSTATSSRHTSHNKSTTTHRRQASSPNRRMSDANHSRNRVRSKSMPTMGNGILHMDRHQSTPTQYPIPDVSTIASIDSSWRYKRIKMMKRLQKHRQQQQQRSDEDIHYEKERIRSISCDPTMLRLVPAHAKQHSPIIGNHDTINSNDNKSNYLNYNLGEMDDELIELLRQQKSRISSPPDSSIWQWPSSSPKSSVAWGKRNRRTDVSTPTTTTTNEGKNDKFVARHSTGSGGGDFSYILSDGEAGTLDSTTWEVHAPDPVKSAHGSSNYFAEEDLRYQGTSPPPTPNSVPLLGPPPLVKSSPVSPENSRESFIGIIQSDGGWLRSSSGEKKSKSSSDSSERDNIRNISSKEMEPMSPPSSPSSPADPGSTSNKNVHKNDDNDRTDSPESIFNNSPSSHAKSEKKINLDYLVPPLHSTVRSKKPTPQQSHSHKLHFHHSNNKSVTGHSTSTELKSRSEVAVGGVEGLNIPMKLSDSSNDLMSELTMPQSLSRVPPPHGVIRSVKPTNRLHGSTSSHPTSPVTTRHPKSEVQKQSVPASPQCLSALRAIHQVHNMSMEHNSSSKGMDHPPKTAAGVSLYPPPPPRRVAPGPPPRNQCRHAAKQQAQVLAGNNIDNPSRPPQAQSHPAGMTPGNGLLDDLAQSTLRSPRERHHQSDRALFPPYASRERYMDMTGGSGGGGHSGVLHSSMNPIFKSNESNNWHMQQLLHSSTTELARLRGRMSPEEFGGGDGGGSQQTQAPPIPSIGGSTTARQRGKRVENMPYMDENQDIGLYTGETNDLGQPHGKGQMRYDNGIFFEGKWTNGVQDGVGASRERLLSGFTSWKGTTPSKKNGTNGKEFAHGMIWVNPYNGRAGRYTGDLNQHGMPHGRGVMRYDFGLIAEGEWINGQIVDNVLQGSMSSSFLAGSVDGSNSYFPAS